MIKKSLAVGVAGVVAVVLAIGGNAQPPEEAPANVAPCAPGVTMAGSESPRWPDGSSVAGPVAVPRNPLARMFEAKNGWLYAKVPLLVAGHRYVVVSVPAELRKRVFLYYGHILDVEGNRTTSFFRARGYGETEFRPCHGKGRTVWPGGVRVRGRAPVSLLVAIEGEPRSRSLTLGRPTPSRGG